MTRYGIRIPIATALLVVSAATVPCFSAPDFAPVADAHEAATLSDRRHLHEFPELSGREFETQAYLRDRLAEMAGIELIDGDWGTGLVGILRGGQPGPLIAWRADIDGLPITETTSLSFASTRRDTLSGGRNVGVMHACGHDIHMSVALGAMRILADLRADMAGDILWIFQPAEETGAGAEAMLAAGVFADGRMPQLALALHDHPTIACGKIGACPGWSSANVDGFELVVHGRGGHGAYPHKAIDPVTLASRIVLALNDLVAREIDVHTPAVISVGSIHGGTKGNVIPGSVTLQATVRTQDDATRELIKEKIERTVLGLVTAAGAPEPELEYFWGTPSGYNDPELVADVLVTARRVLGDENVITYAPGMGGEDFSRFGREVPGFQFRLGVGRPDRPMTLHNPAFDPDERAVVIGMRLVAEILWDALQRP
jgi:amidohydrolase